MDQKIRDNYVTGPEATDNILTEPAGLQQDLVSAPVDQLVTDQTTPVSTSLEVKSPEASAFEAAQYVADGEDPARIARASELSKKYNVPEMFVAKNLEAFEKKERQDSRSFGNTQIKSKRLARWQTDPKNATLSKNDDPSVLAKAEGIRALIGEQENEESYVSYREQVAGAWSRGSKQLMLNTSMLAALFDRGDKEELAEHIANEMAAINQSKAQLTNAKMRQFEESLEKEGEDVSSAWRRLWSKGNDKTRLSRYFDPSKDFLGILGMHVKAADKVIDVVTLQAQSLDYLLNLALNPKESFVTAVESFPVSGAVLGTATVGGVGGFFAGGPVGATVGGAGGAGVSSAIFETGAWLSQAMADRDLDISKKEDVLKLLNDPNMLEDVRGEALRKGITLGVVDGLIQVVGGRVFRALPKTSARAAKSYVKPGIVSKIAGVQNKAISTVKSTAIEGIGESVSEGASQWAAYKDITKVNMGDVLLEGALAPFQGVAMAPVQMLGARTMNRNKVIGDFQDIVVEQEEAEQTLQTLQAMEEVNNVAQESELGQVSPEGYADLIQNSKLGDSDKKVYFQTAEWNKFWEDKGENPAMMFEKLLAGNVEDGSAIEVGLKEFVQTFSGTQEYRELLNILRPLRPEGMTANDAVSVMNSVSEKVKAVAQEAKMLSDREDRIRADVKEFKSKYKEMVKRTGRNDPRGVEVIAMAIESYARDSGQEFSDLANQYFGGIYRSEDYQEAGSDVLEQRFDTQPNESVEERHERITGRIRQRQFSGPIQEIASSTEEAQRISSEPIRNTPSGRKHSQLVRDAAKRYAGSQGIDYVQQRDYVRVDEGRAKRIADAYTEMQHDPENPEVKAAYQALITETLAQYQVIKETGLNVEVITEDMEDPYGGNSQAMIDDVLNNNHMWLYPTDSGLGTLTEITDNPLLGMSGEKIGDFELTHNDIFRIVHDYFGHVKEGVGFRARGEENAWQSHVRMYSKQAARAMTTETRGQNSWLNFGPFGEANRTANVNDTVFADQKVGLLPEWVMEEGLSESDVIPYQEAASDVITQENYHDTTEAHFSGVSTEKAKGLMDAYVAWRRKKNKSDFIEYEGEKYKIDYESIKKNSFWVSRGFSIYLIPESGESVIRISDHWVGSENTKSKYPKSRKFNLSFISNSLWTTDGDRFEFRMPNEKYPSQFIAGEAKFSDFVSIKNHRENIYYQESIVPTVAPAAPIFFSGLAQIVNKEMGNRATKDQVNAMLNKAKKDEVDWLGIREFVESKEGMIEKQELLDFINQNGLQVVPIESGDSSNGVLIREGELVYRQNEYGKRTPVVADPSMVSFVVQDRKKIVDDRDVRSMLWEEVESLYDSEVSSFKYELEEKRKRGRDSDYSIYLPDKLISNMKEKGVEFDGEDQPTNLDAFEQGDIDEMVSDFYSSDEGEEALFEYAKDLYLDGESYYGIDKIIDPNLDIDVWVRTTGYGDQIMDVIYDSDDIVDYIVDELGEDIEGMNVEEFSLQLRQAAIETGAVIIDPSIARIEDGETIENESFNTIQGKAQWQRYTVEGAENYREVKLTLPQVKEKFTYTTHFQDENIVAYLRLSDRTTEDGKKILYAEEIQSDWHQQGRERGYKDANIPKEDVDRALDLEVKVSEIMDKQEALENEASKFSDEERKFGFSIDDIVRPIANNILETKPFNIMPGDTNANLILYLSQDDVNYFENNDVPIFNYLIDNEFTTSRKLKNIYKKHREEIKNLNEKKDAAYKKWDDTRQEIANLESEKESLNSEISTLMQTESVPNAPYKQTNAWTSLALKRLFRMAAEEGYEGVAWTPAEIHQERWGTDRVAWRKTKDGFIVSSREQVGGLADGTNIEELAEARGELRSGETLVNSQEELESAVADILGRERQERSVKSLSETVWNRMQSEDVGKYEPRHEGMENFYNRTVPNQAKAVSKSIGLKVEPLDLSGEAPKSLGVVFTEDATNKMLGEGFALFQQNNAFIEVGANKLMKMFLSPTANASSLVHESAHFYLEMIRDQAAKGDEVAMQRLAAISDEFGEIPLTGKIPVKTHETFARSFEAYLMDPENKGRAPSQKRRKMFAEFRSFLADIYGGLKNFIDSVYANEGIEIKLNEQVREIFDRMLIAQSEVDSVMSSGPQPIFNNYMDKLPESFKNKYLEAQGFAREDAIERVYKKLLKSAEKKKTKAYKDKLKSVRRDVTNRVNAMPVYNILNIMRTGKSITAGPMPEGMESLKINSKELSLLYPNAADMPIFKGITRADGLPVDMVAAMFGYESADDFIYELSMLPPRREYINVQVDEIMGAWSNDMVYDEVSLREEAEKQVSKLSMQTYSRMEYEFLAKNHKGLVNEATRRVISRPANDKHMRVVAERQIEETVIKDIKPHMYRNAERRAAKESGRLFAKNDHEGAFNAKEKELLNAYLYQEAQQAKAFVDKVNKSLKKFFKPDKNLAKTRDMDLIQAARSVLAVYGLGNAKGEPLEYIQSLKDYNQEAYARVSELMVSLIDNPKNYKDMTYGEFNDLSDLLESLWSLSKERKTIETRNQSQTLDEVGDAIVESMNKHNKKDYTERKRKFVSKLERIKDNVTGTKAWLTMYEHWINMVDGGDSEGAARRYLFEPIQLAYENYMDQSKKYQTKYHEIAQRMAKRIEFGKEIASDDLGWTFRDKSEVLGAMMHTGNPSNKRKLLLGYEWGHINEVTGELDTSRWDAFVNKMIADGVLTKEDFDDIQAVWDLMEEMKPLLQKANRKIFGFYFREIKSEGVSTPFGEYRGGYVPASPDRFLERDVKAKSDFETFTSASFANNLPYTGGKGMTLERNKAYNGKLDLNLGRLSAHINDSLKFAIMKPAVFDVFKVVRSKKVSDRINAENKLIISKMIIPALNRADKLSRFNKSPSDDRLHNLAMNWIKRSAAVQILGGSIKNTAEQLGQTFTAQLKVKGTHIYAAAGARVMQRVYHTDGLKDYGKTFDEVAEMSTFMRLRYEDDVHQITRALNLMFEEGDGLKSKYRKARDKSADVAFMSQRLLQRQIDTAVWLGAYNQALGENKSQEQAVRFADTAVSLTQFSRRPFDFSEASADPKLSFFHMFFDYFNAQANIVYSEGNIALRKRNQSMSKTAAKIAVVGALGITLPAAVETLMAKLLFSGGLDSDEDGEYFDDIADVLFWSNFRFMSAMVPAFGPAVYTGTRRFYGEAYEGRVSASPALEATASGMFVLTRLVNNDLFSDPSKKSRDTKELLNAAGLMSGLPLGPLARPINYVQKWQDGEVEPSGPIDAARGLVTGQ